MAGNKRGDTFFKERDEASSDNSTPTKPFGLKFLQPLQLEKSTPGKSNTYRSTSTPRRDSDETSDTDY